MARLRDGVPELRHEDGDGLGEEPVHLQVGNPIQVAEPMQVWFIYWTYKTQYVELNVERLNVEIPNVKLLNVKRLKKLIWRQYVPGERGVFSRILDPHDFTADPEKGASHKYSALMFSPPAFGPNDNSTRTFRSMDTGFQKRFVHRSFGTL